MKINYDKKKIARAAAMVYALGVLCLLLFLFCFQSRVTVMDVSGCQTPDERMVYKIEKLAGVQGYITIEGYAYEKGQSIQTAGVSVLAYDDEKDVYYKLPTEVEVREELSEQAGDGHDYSSAGFRAVVSHKKLRHGDKIYLWYGSNGKNILIPTESVY